MTAPRSLGRLRRRSGPMYTGLFALALLVLPGARASAQALSIDDVTVSETAGTATFTVSLDAASPGIVTVDYQTVDGTATGGADFTALGLATLTFQPNELTQSIVVPILDDALYEQTETFTVALSNPSGATIGDDTGLGSITDDDPVPAIGFTTSAAGAFESAPTLTATVQMSAPAGTDIVIPFSFGGTAVDPDDYTITPPPLVIPAGATSGSIVLTIVNDALDEADETAIVTIFPPSPSPFVTLTWTGTIFDNDSPPGLTVGDVTVQENAGVATVFVSLSGPSGLTVQVDVFTQNGTAVSGQDYTAVPATTLTFPPGSIVQSFDVPIIDDATNEPSESFTTNLNNAVNAAISRATGFVTIFDNDPFPSITVSDLTVPEGGGTGNFVVSLSSPSQQTVTVTIETQDGSAVAGQDYLQVVPTQLTFSPGQATRLAPVTILDDALVEFPENFTLVLSGAVNASIADNTGLGTITDNDAFYPSDFSRYMDLTIESGDPVNQFYSVGFTIDTAALITAGQVKADGSDLAVAWDSTGGGNWIEVDAHLRPVPNQTLATSTATQIWFAIHEPAGIVSPWVNRYRLYYANPLAVPSVRRRDGKQVYRLFDDFNGPVLDTTLWYVHPSYRPAVSVSGGMVHQNGALSPGAVWQGNPIRMITQTTQNVPTYTVSYNQPYAGECRFRSLNITDDVRPVNTLMHMPPPGFPNDHDEYTTFLSSNGSTSVRLVKVVNGTGTGLFSAPNVIATSVWYDLKTTARLTVATLGQEKALHSVYLNDVLVGTSANAARGGYNATITSGQVGIETDPGSAGDYDWFLIRDYTPAEPAIVPDPYVNLKMKQMPGGTEADWSDPGGAASFDVIRGQIGLINPTANALDMGSVFCIENDSTDSTTAPDHLDTASPAPGTAFFYLVRTKTTANAGTYGHSTLGAREVPTAGDCF